MPIKMSEPHVHKYIYINSDTNTVHLMLPIIRGKGINTEVECKKLDSFQEFFGKNMAYGDSRAKDELLSYKALLEFDLRCLPIDSEPYRDKAARLHQVNNYIKALSEDYTFEQQTEKVIPILQRASNLHNVTLSSNTDSGINNLFIKEVTPTFSMDDTGFFQKKRGQYFLATKINRLALNEKIMRSVLSKVKGDVSFEELKMILFDTASSEFNLTYPSDSSFNQKYYDETFFRLEEGDDPVSAKDYIEVIMQSEMHDLCLHESTKSPFYEQTNFKNDNEKVSFLSKLTILYLSQINIYCTENNISTTNFGAILDSSEQLSNDLLKLISESLSQGKDVQNEICNFINEHGDEFKMHRHLSDSDLNKINQSFTNNSPFMKDRGLFDNFFLLNTGETLDTPIVFSHQNNMCISFSQAYTGNDSELKSFFETAANDLTGKSCQLDPSNSSIIYEVDEKLIIDNLTLEQYEAFPSDYKSNILSKNPSVQLFLLTQYIIRGDQEEANKILSKAPSDLKEYLLQTPSEFSDGSGRKFNCTLSEYAYWAQDVHMSHMLDTHMNENSKSIIQEKIETINQNGLKYQYKDKSYSSFHYEYPQLQEAIRKLGDNSLPNMVRKAALADLAEAQQGIPIHFLQAYYGDNRTANNYPMPFEEVLNRNLTALQFNKFYSKDDSSRKCPKLLFKAEHFGKEATKYGTPLFTDKNVAKLIDEQNDLQNLCDYLSPHKNERLTMPL